jgi:hypothetical protein
VGRGIDSLCRIRDRNGQGLHALVGYLIREAMVAETRYPIPDDSDQHRQCVACDYICSDVRVWDDDPFPCPSCKRKGHWSSDVDWSTRDRAIDEHARISQELGLE